MFDIFDGGAVVVGSCCYNNIVVVTIPGVKKIHYVVTGQANNASADEYTPLKMYSIVNSCENSKTHRTRQTGQGVLPIIALGRFRRNHVQKQPAILPDTAGRKYQAYSKCQIENSFRPYIETTIFDRRSEFVCCFMLHA